MDSLIEVYTAESVNSMEMVLLRQNYTDFSSSWWANKENCLSLLWNLEELLVKKKTADVGNSVRGNDVQGFALIVGKQR